MARAEFERVAKRFGDVDAVADFTLSVEDGELVTVLGPSGCGKSTLLRLAAGLEALTRGSIRLGGRSIDRLAPEARDVAMVFQGYALYPHMTVRANIEFPLRMRRTPRGERRRRAAETAALLELEGLLERRPAELSGGQRQRVALARALVRHPALFLLDEPLSNVDARLRASLRHAIRDLQRRLGVTTLHVTHDQAEAMALGDRMVVMHAGRIQQVGAPASVYARPANAFVAGFLGTPPMNLLPGEVTDGGLHVGGQRLVLPPWLAERGRPGERVLVGIRSEAFVPGEVAGGLVAVVDGPSREVIGSETVAQATAGAERLVVRLFTSEELPARVAAPLEALHVFTADGERRLGP